MPAEEDRKGERRDGDDGMPETLLPLFVLLVEQQKRASIYLASFLEPMTTKKKVGKRCVHHSQYWGFQRRLNSLATPDSIVLSRLG